MGIHECIHGALAYKLSLVMGQYIEIFAIYRRHRHYRVSPGHDSYAYLLLFASGNGSPMATNVVLALFVGVVIRF